MKKYLLFVFAACLCSATYAQDNVISKYFAEYESDATFTKVNVTQKTFSLFTEIETQNEDEQKVLGAIAQLNGIKVLHKEKTDDAKALYAEADDKIRADVDYEELASVQTQDENVLFVIREEGGIIKELSIVVGDDQQFLLATLYGEIDLKNISRLTTVIKNNGKEWFDIFENIDSDELVFGEASTKDSNNNQKESSGNDDINVNVYPNPASSYVQLESVDLPGAAYHLSFFSIIGEPVKQVGKITLPYKIQLEDLPSGAYFLRLTNEEGAFKNFRIVKP